MKPLTAEAIKWDGKDETFREVVRLVSKLIVHEGGCLYIPIQKKGQEATMKAEVGDYIVRDEKGKVYPCKADIFKACYEPMNATHYEEELKKSPAVCQVLIEYEKVYGRRKARELFDHLISELVKILEEVRNGRLSEKR